MTRTSIVDALRGIGGSEEQRLRELQRQLGCGTSCGSCLPELRRLMRDQARERTPDVATDAIR